LTGSDPRTSYLGIQRERFFKVPPRPKGHRKVIVTRRACAVVAREERSVLPNETYWHSFCLTDLPVSVMSRLRFRKGNGTIACR
jgi:hypothetical protein